MLNKRKKRIYCIRSRHNRLTAQRFVFTLYVKYTEFNWISLPPKNLRVYNCFFSSYFLSRIMCRLFVCYFALSSSCECVSCSTIIFGSFFSDSGHMVFDVGSGRRFPTHYSQPKVNWIYAFYSVRNFSDCFFFVASSPLLSTIFISANKTYAIFLNKIPFYWFLKRCVLLALFPFSFFFFSLCVFGSMCAKR